MPAIDVNSPHVLVTVRRNRGSKDRRDITDRVVSFKFHDSGTRRTNKVEIVLDAEDGLIWGDDVLLRKGSLLECQFGYPGAIRNIGDFAVKKIRGSRQVITITAYQAKRNRMLRKKRSRQWEKVRRSDVAREIFREQGFSRFVVDQTKDVLQTISQVNETDWRFLRRLASLEHFELYIDVAGAHFEAPRRNAKPTRTLMYVQGVVGVGMIENWSIEDVSANVPGRIILRGYDPLKGKEFEALANGETSGAVTLSDGVDIVDPDEGDAQGGQVGAEQVMPTGARTQEEAQSEANALYKKQRYAAVKLKLTTTGDPWISSRTIQGVEGLGALIDGRWWVKLNVHSISGGNYGCEVTLNKDGLNKKKSAKKKGDRKGRVGIVANYDRLHGQGDVSGATFIDLTPESGSN